MDMTLLLPWFPIILAVGVGGRLLGRGRGLALGLFCAMFWVLLVQASLGPRLWQDAWTVFTILAGSVAIVAMGGWSGEGMRPGKGGWSDAATASGRGVDEGSRVSNAERVAPGTMDAVQSAERSHQALSAVLDRFDDWVAEHEEDSDPWPAFGEFIRTALYECVRATHVRPWRLTSDAEVLIPLREADPFADVERLPAREGIVGRVLSTGRSYVAGQAREGVEEATPARAIRTTEKADELIVARDDALGMADGVHWCFAVRVGGRSVGVVVVGQLDLPPEEHGELLRVTERMVALCWAHLAATIENRTAGQSDPVAGVYTRQAFLKHADRSLRESLRQGEPVTVAIIAIEGLRELADSGRWERADELIAEVSRLLRRKVRADDRLGRFDDSRFVLLLRRVDAELAGLIVGQLSTRLAALSGEYARWQAKVMIRCGVVGSGSRDADLRTLMARALSESSRARCEGLLIAGDVAVPASAGAIA